MTMRRRWLCFLPLAGLAGWLPTDCASRRHDDEPQVVAEKAALPQLTLRDDTADLWLTWVDDKGETHTATHPAEVPDAGRERVRVVVGDREDGTRGVFYVADLTRTTASGGYVVTTAPRRAWEDEIEKRRNAYLATVAPPPSAPYAPPSLSGTANEGQALGEAVPGGVMVIIYGASWCGACHEAANYLRAKHVRYVLKDIEATPSAAAEMQEKLARAGRRGGSIPVIDVGGEILVGFAPAAVDQALARRMPAHAL
jgi:glutaredoxin